MVPGADGDVLLVQYGAEIVRVHAFEREADKPGAVLSAEEADVVHAAQRLAQLRDQQGFVGVDCLEPDAGHVVAGRAELLDAMPPWHGGGAMIENVTFKRTTYAPPPGRFEAGTPHIVGVLGLHAAVDYVDDIGLARIHAHETALVAQAREALSQINSVRLFGPDDSAGIVSFAVEGVHPHDVATILDEGNVAIRAGHHCAQPLMDALGVPATARASFGVYNGADDIAALVKGVERVTRIFG